MATINKEHKMERIKVKICMGTACYVSGSGDFLFIKDELDAETAGRIDLEAIPCLMRCDTSGSKPPFVFVEDVMISSADVPSVKRAIEAVTTRLEREPKGGNDGPNE